MGDRMTALDAAFYHLERTGQLLHVGGVYTVDGPLDYERTLADLSARLHLIPRYTQRVVPVPLNLGHPTWEPARGFDVRHHVVRHTLRRAGRRRAARAAWPAASSPSRSTARARSGSCTRSTATAAIAARILAKVHHCMIDGVSGVQLLGRDVRRHAQPAAAAAGARAAEAPPPLPDAVDAGAARAGGRRRRPPSRALRALRRAAPPARRGVERAPGDGRARSGEMLRLAARAAPADAVQRLRRHACGASSG